MEKKKHIHGHIQMSELIEKKGVGEIELPHMIPLLPPVSRTASECFCLPLSVISFKSLIKIHIFQENLTQLPSPHSLL